MPNRSTHLIAGGLSGLIVVMFDKNDNYETKVTTRRISND